MEVVFCYSLIERNKRLVLQAPEVSSLPEAQKLQSHLSVSSLLDCFFPFDPYCLARWAGLRAGHVHCVEAMYKDFCSRKVCLCAGQADLCTRCTLTGRRRRRRKERRERWR